MCGQSEGGYNLTGRYKKVVKPLMKVGTAVCLPELWQYQEEISHKWDKVLNQ